MDKPLLNVRICSHGKHNDGGFVAVQEGARFSFPACGRLHVATRDKYEIDPDWIEEQERLEKMRARARVAREARQAQRRDDTSDEVFSCESR